MAQNIQVARRHVGVSNELGLHLRVADKFVKTGKCVPVRSQGLLQGNHSQRQEHPELAGARRRVRNDAGSRSQGCDAEDAVAALGLDLAPSHDSEDQNRGAELEPEVTPDPGSTKEGVVERRASEPEERTLLECGPRWDSRKRGSRTGPGIDRRAAIRGRWNR